MNWGRAREMKEGRTFIAKLGGVLTRTRYRKVWGEKEAF